MVKSKNNSVVKHFRSDGKVAGQTYCKHSDSLSLEAEAMELKRCSKLSLNTKSILTTEFIAYDKANNNLTIKLINGDGAYARLRQSTSLLSCVGTKRTNDKFALDANIVGLGHWLRIYHESPIQSDLPAESAYEIHRSFSAKTKGIRDKNLMSGGKVKKIEQRFLTELENIKSEKYRENNQLNVCQIHGDFIIHNMMIDEGSRLHVLDFGDTRIGCNIDDIVRFYSNLWAISQVGWISKKRVGQLALDFLQSYRLTVEVIETPYFESMMAYNFLIHLYSHYFIKDSLSFMSNLELTRITNAGLKWIDQRIA